MLLRTSQFLIVAAFCALCTNAEYSDCGSAVGSVISVQVSNCNNDDDRCILKRNSNATIGINFTSNVASDAVKSVVHGLIMGVPVAFTLPNPDGCKDSGVSCPISQGQSYAYKTTLPVLQRYPRITVEVKWELQDKDGKDIVCILIPAKIK